MHNAHHTDIQHRVYMKKTGDNASSAVLPVIQKNILPTQIAETNSSSKAASCVQYIYVPEKEKTANTLIGKGELSEQHL